MLKLNIDQLRQPFGGHQFYEDGYLISGDTFKEVEKKLTEFRINNNRPVGNPAQEILQHYAKNWPWMVLHDDKKEANPVPKDYDVYRKWIWRVWMHPPNKTVSTKEASGRWDVCKTCPYNKGMTWEETNESSELARRAFLMRRGIEVPEELGFCSRHGADLGVLTFVETPRELSGMLKDAAPYPRCWV